MAAQAAVRVAIGKVQREAECAPQHQSPPYGAGASWNARDARVGLRVSQCGRERSGLSGVGGRAGRALAGLCALDAEQITPRTANSLIMMSSSGNVSATLQFYHPRIGTDAYIGAGAFSERIRCQDRSGAADGAVGILCGTEDRARYESASPPSGWHHRFDEPVAVGCVIAVESAGTGRTRDGERCTAPWRPARSADQ